MRRLSIDRIVIRAASRRDAQRIAATAAARVRESVAESDASDVRGRIAAGLARLVKETRHAR